MNPETSTLEKVAGAQYAPAHSSPRSRLRRRKQKFDIIHSDPLETAIPAGAQTRDLDQMKDGNSHSSSHPTVSHQDGIIASMHAESLLTDEPKQLRFTKTAGHIIPTKQVERIHRKMTFLLKKLLHSRSEKREYTICTSICSLNKFPVRSPTVGCSHDVDICTKCLRTWINVQFVTKIWNEINCPVCPSRLELDDIRNFGSHRIYRKYERLHERAVLEDIPNFTWCLAQDCSNGQVHDPYELKFTCKKCKRAWFTAHDIPWHKGDTCAKYDYRRDTTRKDAEEGAAQTLIKKIAKQCPGCKMNVEKEHGCDHMQYECAPPIFGPQSISTDKP